MTKTMRTLAVVTLAAGFILAGARTRAQDLPGKHPGYLHALSDLRSARWFLFHQPGDGKVYQGEDVAIREIDAAIKEIKHAAIDDGKNINDHMNVDAAERGSRLERAIDALKQARADIRGEEDNPETKQLRHWSLEHIDRAVSATELAHQQWLKEHNR